MVASFIPIITALHQYVNFLGTHFSQQLLHRLY
jgi:hypothetical protein